MNLAKFYYDFMQDKEKNPLIDYMREDLDVTTLSEIKAELLAARKSKKGLFNTARYPYYRQVLAYYYKLRTEEGLNDVVGLEARLSGIPFFRVIKRRKIRDEFIRTLVAIDEFVKEYDCLNRVLTPDGYLAVIDNILRGNVSYVKLVYEALDNYITLRDESKFISSLNRDRLLVLNFAYSLSSSFKSYLEIIDKLPEIRIYHELTKYEFSAKDELAALLEYPDVVSRIERLNEKKRELAERITTSKFGAGYKDFYLAAQNNKDYLYQISKTQKLQPIRRTMEDFSEFLLSLFPCWLLSPENVSSLLPLKKNLFDVVIFDEASQVFIENTIPAVFRGARVVVAGDDKQLRPSATFMKRYLGADIDDTEDPSLQAALEVDSLLDLAKSRFDSAHLCYHYRSKHSELIDFSNRAFYSSSLQIAPNVTRGAIGTPIERYKVDGVWEHRHNTREAEEVVRLLENILKKRKEGESIGIITFNSEQQSHINDLIDKRAEENADFRTRIARERSRVEGGEDVSLFVKNLENVQGDERDIIIFSVGYARNSEGKLHASFGSLSTDGGENRLNVAITRAKSRVIIVTSIEPEELHVEDAKNRGPRLLQKYLAYARSVAAGQTDESSALLSALSECDNQRERILTTLPEVEEELKERLTKLGYTVYTKLGTEKNRISLAVYDKEYDRYLVGVELDSDAFVGTDSTLERDVYKPKFLKSRGWRVIRIWCRDFWLSPTAVVKKIAAEADRAKGALAGTETPVSKRKTKRA